MAVTIDDLPAVCTCKSEAWSELTDGLLSALVERSVPSVGFVNEGKLFRRQAEGSERGAPEAKRVELLERWLDAGQELGNHSYSHPNLHATALEGIPGRRASRRGRDASARRLSVGVLPRRSSATFGIRILRTGQSLEKKRQFESFLAEHDYSVAPVTIDNAEWIYARAFDVAVDRGRSGTGQEGLGRLPRLHDPTNGVLRGPVAQAPRSGAQASSVAARKSSQRNGPRKSSRSTGRPRVLLHLPRRRA